MKPASPLDAFNKGGVAVTWPHWTVDTNGATDTIGGGQDGTHILNAMKFNFNTVNAVADHVAVLMPRGAPFCKATGDNEIKVVGDSSIKCYKYGNLPTKT